jgi:hypothetical protein
LHATSSKMKMSEHVFVEAAACQSPQAIPSHDQAVDYNEAEAEAEAADAVEAEEAAAAADEAAEEVNLVRNPTCPMPQGTVPAPKALPWSSICCCHKCPAIKQHAHA